MRWFALLNQDGSIAQQVQAEDVDTVALQNEWPVDQVLDISRPGDVRLEHLSKNGWQEDSAAVEALLLADLETHFMAKIIAVTTPGKESIYQAKAAEVAAWWSDAAPEKGNFPFAIAEAEARGIDLSDVIAEYAGAMELSRTTLAGFEAQWQAGKANIRGAETAQEKRLAAAETMKGLS